MTSDVPTVDGSYSLVEFQLVEVRMGLGTVPFAKALHRCVTVLMHYLLAERATLAKEPREEIQQHARDLPV